jgi:hypothetical protein
MDKTHKDLDGDSKTYADLTQVQGKIRLLPGTKRNIKAFVQWVKDECRLGSNPATTAFPVGDAENSIRRYNTHEQFREKSKTIMDTAKPSRFTDRIKWEDWSPTFLTFLRSIPG